MSIKIVDLLTSLLFQKEIISQDDDVTIPHFRTVNPKYKDFFEINKDIRFGIKPTQILIDIINILNSRGQSILYCAYRNYTNSNSLDCIGKVPGINLQLNNTNGDLPIIGLVWENTNHELILELLLKYKRVTKLTFKESDVYDILHKRLKNVNGYIPLDF